MRLTHIEVDGFKSLVRFQMDFSPFTCLIGLNGSGKTTVLQFLDFLSKQMQGTVGTWLEDRRWLPTDLRSPVNGHQTIDFRAEFASDDGPLSWEASFDPSRLACGTETITSGDLTLEVRDRHLVITGPLAKGSSLGVLGSVSKLPLAPFRRIGCAGVRP